MTTRLSCCIPFCRRTLRNDGGYAEWICGKHWAGVSKTTKRRRRLADKAAKRASDRLDESYAKSGLFTEAQMVRYRAVKRLSQQLWLRCKNEAINRAMGI